MKKIVLVIVCLIWSVLSIAQTQQPCFELTPDKIIPPTQNALDMVSADFNSDGIVDLAVTAGCASCTGTNNPGSMLVYLASGSGTFAAAVTYSFAHVPNVMTSGDFNSDGNPDLAIGNYGTLSVLLGSASGVFSAISSYSVSFDFDMVSTDINGDGKIDLVGTNNGANKARVLFGTGTGSFSAPFDYPVGSDPRNITVNDFNHDGKIDIATSNFGSNNVSVLLNTGSGNFGVATNYYVGPDPMSITSHDFNGDGFADIVVDIQNNAGSYSSCNMILGSGSGSMTVIGGYSIGRDACYRIITTDLNGDGIKDIVTTGHSYVSVLIGNNTGSFANAVNYQTYNLSTDLCVLDYNSDGKKDLVYNDNGLALRFLQGNGDGTFISPRNYETYSAYESLTVGDFNTDGNKDIAYTNSTYSISIMLGSNSGTFAPASHFNIGSDPKLIYSADFNNNGILDLVITGLSTGAILLGNGSGLFGAPINLPIMYSVNNISIGDYDADGNMDLVVVNQNDHISILKGSGTGNFTNIVDYDLSAFLSQIGTIKTGDFNGDSKLDIVFGCNSGMGDIGVMYGSGTGFFSTVSYFSTGGIYNDGITVNDFNGDGKKDFAVASSGSSGLKVFISVSTNSFTAVSYNPILSNSTISSADFNGDGKIDIAVGSILIFGSNPILLIFMGNGNGTFSPAFINDVHDVSFVSADFNNDGSIDLAGFDPSNINVLLNHGAPNITISSSNTVCIGSSATITANGSSTYVWSTGVTSQSIVVTPTVTATYSVIGINTSGCSNSQTVSVTVDNTCQDVWPGDANSDGVADNLDVLELGLHYTQTGTPRATTSNLWQSYYAANWSGTITNGKNLNHSNCNGDGVINDDDTLAIYTNYSLMHAFKPEQITTNPQIMLVPDQTSLVAGSWGSTSIFLGDAITPISNINGVAFTINYDNTLLVTDSVWIEYPTSFINASNQNLKFRKRNFTNGKLYTATTHTINGNISGYGKIAILHYKTKPNAYANNVMNLTITQANQSNSSGNIIPLTSGSSSVSVAMGINELTDGNYLSILPNPAKDILMIELNTTNDINATIEMTNTLGQLVLSSSLKNNKEILNITHLSNGVYFVKVLSINKQIGFKKIVVQR